MDTSTWLANMYGNAPQAAESNEKTAQLELFAKLAAEQGVDLSVLSADQINELYHNTFKVAEDDKKAPPFAKKEETKEEEDKEEKAKEEHKEAHAKFAEADLMGRTMAHALVDELRNIEKQASGLALAGKAAEPAKSLKDRVMGAAGAAKDTVIDAGKKLHGAAAKTVELARKNPVAAGGIAAGTLAAGAGGAYLASRGDKKKEASALDELAAIQAVKTAAAAGFNLDEACELVAQAMEQSGPSTKIASIQDTSAAIHVRGLEFLETAGYPVDWTQIYGA